VLCLLSLTLGICQCEIISNPVVTSWGDWGNWDDCPAGQFAIGFQLKAEGEQGRGDDTALNSIKLMCGKPGSRNTYKFVQSTEGGWGNWREPLYCDGLLTGFQLKSEAHQGKGDDTAANNMNGICTLSNGQVKKLQGDGMHWGHWTAEQHCQHGFAICGIRTQVEGRQGNGDDTSLNNVQMRCCNFLDVLTACSPLDKWEVIADCDNKGSSSPLTCSYEETIGVTTADKSSSGGSVTDSVSASFGVELGAVTNILSYKFKTELSTSKVTKHDWATESSRSWSKITKHTATFTVPGQARSRLLQVVGHCGNYRVHSSQFKKEDNNYFI